MTPVPPSLGFHEGVAQPLEKRFEVIKDVGDGSFGSVCLARVRGTRNTVAIKSMKKSFESFSECLRLREVQSLRAIPRHPHIVPVLDAFLDPITHKLHLVMELMEINLYQFLKARENRPLEPRTVQVILWQVVSALQHIHAHGFFHRDIKPENVLISIIPPAAQTNPPNRHIFTPPATPPAKQTPSSYLVKLADFGLAREIRSRPPYTSYVSTRWYRAPEVLLRAEEYSAPVDIWAMGAMAIEVATLRPIFPGNNEIDQLWRVTEVMGTPSDWHTTDERTGRRIKIGGGPWNQGLKLASALSFKFPQVPPMEMTTILTAPWPRSLSDFVVACLAWDPKKRPNSVQCLNHEYFRDVERYLPVRELIPGAPATLSPSSSSGLTRKPSLKGLGIDVPIPPRGARQQPSYTQIPAQPYHQQEINHHQPQIQVQQSKGGWFKRDKKRDSSNSQPPAQAPQLPSLNVGSSPSVPGRINYPGMPNGGMAQSVSPQVHKVTKSTSDLRSQHPGYPRDDYSGTVQMPITSQPQPLAPPKQPEPPSKPTYQIHYPGQGNLPPPAKMAELQLPALPSIRPSSPLLGEVFNGNRMGEVKKSNGLESPKREKSPIKVVNTFLLQAQALEAEEKKRQLEQQRLLEQEREQQRIQQQQLEQRRIQQQLEQQRIQQQQEQLRLQQQQEQLRVQQQQQQQQRMQSSGPSAAELSPTKVGRQLSAASTLPSQPLPSPSAAVPSESPHQETEGLSRSSSQKGFFSHFRKRARKRMSTSEDISPTESSPGTSMPISPLPQLQFGRNSVVMEDSFEDAQEELPFESMDFVKEVDMGLKQRQNQHITIAPSPVKGVQKGGSGPPSSHKGGAIPAFIPAKATNRHIPSPYPDVPKLAPLTIPKRGSSRTHGSSETDSGTSSRARKSQTTTNNSSRMDDGIKIPGAYPLSASPDTSTGSLSRRNSIPLSSLSVQLPGAYPREQSSSGRSSAASYRTAFEPDTFDVEEQKQREEQMMLRQSLMEATRAIRAMEKHPYTDFAEHRQGQKFQGSGERHDVLDSAILCDTPSWPTPSKERGGSIYFG